MQEEEEEEAREAFEPLLHRQTAKWHAGPDSPHVLIFLNPRPLRLLVVSSPH